jgi:hypothetical protein
MAAHPGQRCVTHHTSAKVVDGWVRDSCPGAAERRDAAGRMGLVERGRPLPTLRGWICTGYAMYCVPLRAESRSLGHLRGAFLVMGMCWGNWPLGGCPVGGEAVPAGEGIMTWEQVRMSTTKYPGARKVPG